MLSFQCGFLKCQEVGLSMGQQAYSGGCSGIENVLEALSCWSIDACEQVSASPWPMEPALAEVITPHEAHTGIQHCSLTKNFPGSEKRGAGLNTLPGWLFWGPYNCSPPMLPQWHSPLEAEMHQRGPHHCLTFLAMRMLNYIPSSTVWKKKKKYFDTADIPWTKKYWSVGQSLTQPAPVSHASAFNSEFSSRALSIWLMPLESRSCRGADCSKQDEHVPTSTETYLTSPKLDFFKKEKEGVERFLCNSKYEYKTCLQWICKLHCRLTSLYLSHLFSWKD